MCTLLQQHMPQTVCTPLRHGTGRHHRLGGSLGLPGVERRCQGVLPVASTCPVALCCVAKRQKLGVKAATWDRPAGLSRSHSNAARRLLSAQCPHLAKTMHSNFQPVPQTAPLPQCVPEPEERYRLVYREATDYPLLEQVRARVSPVW